MKNKLIKGMSDYLNYVIARDDLDEDFKYDISREVSIILIKELYGKKSAQAHSRLGSLKDYIEKAVPNKCDGLNQRIDKLLKIIDQ